MALVQEPIFSSSKGLSKCVMDGLFHHFTEEIPHEGNSSSNWVVGAHEKLRAVKSKVVTELMNASSYRTALCSEKKFNPAATPKGYGSLIAASLIDISSVSPNSIGITQPVPVYLKTATSVNGINHAVDVVPEILKAMLQRDNIWRGCDKLRRAVYDVVYSSESVPALSKWKIAVDGNSISVCTASGINLECALLHTRLSNKVSRESDQTFARRVLCQGVTRTYSSQPLVITIQATTPMSHMLQACVYPSSTNATGLLMATTHVSGFERPLRSCATVVPCSLRRNPNFGVHEADVSSLITPYVRTHMLTLATMFSKCAIMRAVLGGAAPGFASSQMGDMDELEIHKQYTNLRGICTSNQLKSCASIWAEVNSSRNMNTTCVSGTVDAFENDEFHTDISMHTHSMMNTTFKYKEKDFDVSTPIVVSLYGTYYHHM
jgi:hypothetical protein